MPDADAIYHEWLMKRPPRESMSIKEEYCEC